MKISKQAQRDARQIFRLCLAEGVLDEVRAAKAVKLLAESKPRGYVEILSRLHRLVKLDVAKRTAKVEGAVESTPAQVAGIKADLEKRYGAGLTVSYAVNPSLIGG